MLLDYSAIVPGAAAGLMGLVTAFSKDGWRWRKPLIAVLTVVAIGGSGVSQWWTGERARRETERRREITEPLKEFYARCEELLKSRPAPERVAEWNRNAEEYFNSARSWVGAHIGQPAVARFLDMSGPSYSYYVPAIDDSSLNAISKSCSNLKALIADPSWQNSSETP